MKKLALVLGIVATSSFPMCLSACGQAALDDVETTAEKIDVGAQKIQATIAVLRVQAQPYAQLAVQACGEVKLDPKVCAELDSLSVKLVQALAQAQAALDLYNEGKGDFIDAFEATQRALELGKDYASKVMSLVQRASV